MSRLETLEQNRSAPVLVTMKIARWSGGEGLGTMEMHPLFGWIATN